MEKNLKKEAIVLNELGLHARPAAMIAKVAMQAGSGVWLIKNGEQVDATSIIDILSLAGTKNSRIIVKIENPSDIEIMEEIIRLFDSGFEE